MTWNNPFNPNNVVKASASVHNPEHGPKACCLSKLREMENPGDYNCNHVFEHEDYTPDKCVEGRYEP